MPWMILLLVYFNSAKQKWYQQMQSRVWFKMIFVIGIIIWACVYGVSAGAGYIIWNMGGWEMFSLPLSIYATTILLSALLHIVINALPRNYPWVATLFAAATTGIGIWTTVCFWELSSLAGPLFLPFPIMALITAVALFWISIMQAQGKIGEKAASINYNQSPDVNERFQESYNEPYNKNNNLVRTIGHNNTNVKLDL